MMNVKFAKTQEVGTNVHIVLLEMYAFYFSVKYFLELERNSITGEKKNWIWRCLHSNI